MTTLENIKTITLQEAQKNYSKNVVKLSKIRQYMEARERELEDIKEAITSKDFEYAEMSRKTADDFEKKARFLLQQLDHQDFKLMLDYNFTFIDGEGGKHLVSIEKRITKN